MLLIVLLTLMLGSAALLGWAARRWPRDSTALVEAVNALLPQTQCAQCGYPGCRPYAEALVNDAVAETLCPPGGEATAVQLRTLLGRDAPGAPVAEPVTLLAVIDEPRCIGCYLCIPACPVDAIIGAPGYMHTVVARECTGCELCVEPCPVDCISMVSA